MIKLHAYTTTYNDLYMIRHFVRHYSRYASRIFVWDDDSTDGTREFLDSCAPLVTVLKPPFTGLDQIKLQELRSNAYKELSRGQADWVLIGDSDEFHYHPDLLAALEREKQRTMAAVVTHGFDMFSEKPPEGDVQMTDVVKDGIPDRMYDRVIFNPEVDILIGIGLHGFTIQGGGGNVNYLEFQKAGQDIPTSGPQEQKIYQVQQGDPEFKMLHYKFLGFEYVTKRHALVWSRLSQSDKAHRWGIHTSPEWNQYYSPQWYRQMLSQKKRVI